MTGYERVERGKEYYVSELDASASVLNEADSVYDNDLYEYANYYSDKTVAQNNARADRLMRQLRRYAVEHNEGEIDWKNSEQEKFFIGYYSKNEEICSIGGYFCCRGFREIYFTSREIAEQAIEEFKDELLWYFTEYQDHIANADKKVECDCCGNAEKLNAMATLEFEFCPKCGNKLGGAE